MNRKMIVFMIVILSGCFSKPTMMTMQSYDEVQIGAPVSSLMQTNGEPNFVIPKKEGDEYLYIERVSTGNQLIYENHYKIFVENGKIVSKSVERQTISSFDLIYQDDPNHNQYP